MNTHGHEDVAKTAGIPLLEDPLGKDFRSVQALYLGNWMTDVSQSIDSVAYLGGSTSAKQAITAIVDDVKKSINGIIDEWKRPKAGHR